MKIGFAEGVLGEAPVRLVVPYRDDEVWVVEKPAGVAAAKDARAPNAPSLAGALRAALEVGKPELARAGIVGAWPVASADTGIEGLAMYAQDASAAEVFRNALGSGGLRFGWVFLAEKKAGEEAGASANEVAEGTDGAIVCELPIALDRQTGRSRVSHRHGKKAATAFRRMGALGAYGLWEAEAEFPRPDQVRLHASEVGLRIAGEDAYGSVGPVKALLGRRGEKILYENVALEMRWVGWEFEGRSGRAERVASRGWGVMAKKLG